VCVKAKDSLWYLDSGFFRHMISDKSKLIELVLRKAGYVTYGDNNKGRIMGEGNIGKGLCITISNKSKLTNLVVC